MSTRKSSYGNAAERDVTTIGAMSKPGYAAQPSSFGPSGRNPHHDPRRAPTHRGARHPSLQRAVERPTLGAVQELVVGRPEGPVARPGKAEIACQRLVPEVLRP